MTPREIARIEALSLQLREESLRARALIVSRVGQGAGRIDGRQQRRSVISPGLYAEVVAYQKAHPDSTKVQLCAALRISEGAAGIALGRARRLGELPLISTGRRRKPGGRTEQRELRRGLAAEGSST